MTTVLPVCVEKIYVVNAKFLERLVTGFLDVCGGTIDHLSRRRTGPKLGRQEYLTTLSGTFEPVYVRACILADERAKPEGWGPYHLPMSSSESPYTSAVSQLVQPAS
jgi:hypothetical protein